MLADLGHRTLVVVDDLPFLTAFQVRQFCDLIRPLVLRFRCNFRADRITPAIARMLAEAGCVRIQIGVESVTEGVLTAVRKRLGTEAAGRAIAICREAGIAVKAMFVWGLPGDGPATARQTVKWVRRWRPDSIQVSTFVPLPGSPLWRDGYGARVTDYRALNFFDRDDQPMGFGNDRYGPAELAAWRRWLLDACWPWTQIDLGLAVPGASRVPCEEVSP
jgi:radical SAM superfamily enzyme YgiQ (UPF0313 family)